MRPSAILALNSSAVNPQPILAWKGPRRVDALITRVTSMRSTRCAIDVRNSGSESIRKPGLTPVPRTVLPAFVAAASTSAAASGLSSQGNNNSSDVETISKPACKSSRTWGLNWSKKELVVCRITSASTSKSATLPLTSIPSGLSSPITSPRSLPVFSGSMSMPPTTSRLSRSAISRAVAQPIGPRPYWITRIFSAVSGIEQTPRLMPVILLRRSCAAPMLIVCASITSGYGG